MTTRECPNRRSGNWKIDRYQVEEKQRGKQPVKQASSSNW
jgi:hypothetical protein